MVLPCAAKEKQLGDTHPPKPKPKPVQLPSIYKTFVRSSEQQKQLNESESAKMNVTYITVVIHC